MHFPKGILFDFDGTLVDSEKFHFRSARNLFKRDFGVEITWEYYNQKMAGIPLSKSSPDFIKELKLPTTPKEVTKAFDLHTSQMLETEEVPLMPHALTAINFFEKHGCRLGIVTGSGRRDVSLTLRRLNLFDRFQILVTNDDVENVKPHGEPYLKGIVGLELEKEDVIAFEDSPNGMTSALNAGLTCIGIQSEPILSQRMTHGKMLFKGFDEVLDFVQRTEDQR